MQIEREQAFRRNERLEALLQEMNEILEPAEDRILENHHMPRYPVIFIVGCARAGSTLMMQWLASTGIFAYPTNLLSRFYAAPSIGSRIQQLLTDSTYRFRDEFDDCATALQFSSDLGKTKGTLAPNEFWYFWRRFFHYGEIQQLDEDELACVDGAKFLAELAALEAVFDKPFVLKALIINWNIPFIARIFDKVLFIHITRQPLHNAQSLLESREKYFGTIDEWYSFKANPRPNVNVLARLDESTIKAKDDKWKMDDHPLIWWNEKDGMRSFYTVFGHTHEAFQDRLVIDHIKNAINWAAKRID